MSAKYRLSQYHANETTTSILSLFHAYYFVVNHSTPQTISLGISKTWSTIFTFIIHGDIRKFVQIRVYIKKTIKLSKCWITLSILKTKKCRPHLGKLIRHFLSFINIANWRRYSWRLSIVMFIGTHISMFTFTRLRLGFLNRLVNFLDFFCVKFWGFQLLLLFQILWDINNIRMRLKIIDDYWCCKPRVLFGLQQNLKHNN